MLAASGTPSRDSNTYEPSIYSGLPGCNNDADHNLSSINHMSPYYIAYRIELYRKTVCDIGRFIDFLQYIFTVNCCLQRYWCGIVH